MDGKLLQRKMLEREEAKEGAHVILLWFDFIYSFMKAYYILNASQRRRNHFLSQVFVTLSFSFMKQTGVHWLCPRFASLRVHHISVKN